ncbi:MAG: BrnT family toxin [Rhodospirillales bacterium]
MLYSWDETKCAANIAKHGVDFDAVWFFDWNNASVIADLRSDYGEERKIAYGDIGGRLHALVYVDLDPEGRAKRVISLRRANDRERRKHG